MSQTKTIVPISLKYHIPISWKVYIFESFSPQGEITNIKYQSLVTR